MLSIMNKELERLAFLKGFRIGLITAKSNFDVNNYINKLDKIVDNQFVNITNGTGITTTTNGNNLITNKLIYDT